MGQDFGGEVDVAAHVRRDGHHRVTVTVGIVHARTQQAGQPVEVEGDQGQSVGGLQQRRPICGAIGRQCGQRRATNQARDEP